ncbi:MAG: hypothetical protein C0478_05970 [Planctomyces sp.]|jgi:hypothetical protein|nr:hypothetical protein [Planctomyces sp.]
MERAGNLDFATAVWAAGFGWMSPNPHADIPDTPDLHSHVGMCCLSWRGSTVQWPQWREKPVSEDLEFEEVSSEEVDRVVAALEELMNSVTSETIRAHLEDISNTVYYLVYDEEEEEEGLSEAA